MKEFLVTKNNLDYILSVFLQKTGNENSKKNRKKFKQFILPDLNIIYNKYKDKKPKNMDLKKFIELQNKKIIKITVEKYKKLKKIHHSNNTLPSNLPDMAMNRSMSDPNYNTNRPITSRPQSMSISKQDNQNYTQSQFIGNPNESQTMGITNNQHSFLLQPNIAYTEGVNTDTRDSRQNINSDPYSQNMMGQGSGRVDPRNIMPQDNYGRQDPRNMDPRGMDPRGMDPHNMDPRGMDPRNMDPRGMDPRGMDPRNMNPRGMDPRNMDPRGMDSRGMDNYYQEPEYDYNQMNFVTSNDEYHEDNHDEYQFGGYDNNDSYQDDGKMDQNQFQNKLQSQIQSRGNIDNMFNQNQNRNQSFNPMQSVNQSNFINGRQSNYNLNGRKKKYVHSFKINSDSFKSNEYKYKFKKPIINITDIEVESFDVNDNHITITDENNIFSIEIQEDSEQQNYEKYDFEIESGYIKLADIIDQINSVFKQLETDIIMSINENNFIIIKSKSGKQFKLIRDTNTINDILGFTSNKYHCTSIEKGNQPANNALLVINNEPFGYINLNKKKNKVNIKKVVNRHVLSDLDVKISNIPTYKKHSMKVNVISV